MHPNTRKSIRWKGYDYTQEGAYYITVCAFESRQFFGQVENGQMMLNEIGRIVQACWDAIPDHMAHVDIDEFVVMPNHMHGIVVIRERAAGARAGARHDAPVHAPAAPAPGRPPGIPPGALGQIVASFKSSVSRQVYRDGLLPRNVPVWQRNYWDHVIRDAAEYARIAEYIRNNPAKWDRDRFNRDDP